MIQQISLQGAQQLIADGEVIIADVRDYDSYRQGHIENAIHLSMSILQEFCQSVDRNKPIIVYCYHGISSQAVAQHLLDQGFINVYSLAGGFETWKEQHATG